MSYFKNILLPALFICLFTFIADAQTKEGNITVSVKDQFDGVIADVEVKLRKVGDKETIFKTNVQGVAHLPKLTSGEYQILVTAQGFRDYESKTINLKPGQSLKLDVVLDVALVESNVEIGDADVVEAERGGTATVLDKKVLQELPDDPQELERMLKRLGEAVTGEELPISVNGVQGAKTPPKQAIQQVRINQNVFSAQYDGPFGGGIDIFTQAKVDKYSGYISGNFADSRLNAIDPFLGRRVPFQGRGFGISLDGPLGKKANFYVGGSRNESDSSSVINAVVLNSNLQPVDFRQSFANPTRSYGFYPTINADIGKKHKLNIGYSLFGNSSTGQGVGNFSLPSRANNSKSQSHYFQIADTFLVNDNVVSQTRLSLSYDVSKYFGGSNEVALNVLDAFFGGGSQQDSVNKNFRFTAANETTWQMGKYALGFGWRLRGEYTNQVSRSNFGGTYTFSGRVAPVLDANNNITTDAAGNIVTAQISSLESYRRTLLFRQLGFSAQRIRELGGGVNQFTISGGNPELSASQYDYGFYLQNSYKLTDTVVASFGVRYENQTNLSSDLNFAPRFGITWAPKAKEKQNPLYSLPRLSVGYGIFYNRFSLGSTVNLRQANDPDRLQYLITEANILNTYPTVPSIGLLQQFALPRIQRFLSDNFQTPYQSLVNVNATKKMPKGYTLNFTFAHARFSRQSFIQNINAPLAGTFNILNPATALRPLGNIGNVYETQAIGRTQTTRFSVNLAFPNSPKLYAFVRYGFAKSKNNIVTGSGSSFDSYDFSQEFGPTQFDGVHTLNGYFSYKLPYKVAISGDFRISSGSRFNIFTGRDTNGDGYFSERPSFATNLSKPNLVYTDYGILDPNPAPGDKLIPRNLGRGPKSILFNSTISKSFGFGEDKANKKPAKRTLRFSATINNVFNIINKSNPVGNMSSPNFLRVLSGTSGNAFMTDEGYYIVSGGLSGGIGRGFSFGAGFSF